MFIDRKSFNQRPVVVVTKTPEGCLNCEDCKGPCLDLLEMTCLPDVLLERREART